MADVKASHDMGARPLYVLTAMQPPPEAVLAEAHISTDQAAQIRALGKELHNEIAAWSTNSQHMLVPDAGHDIPMEQPGAVIHAVDAVVQAVRGGEALKP